MKILNQLINFFWTSCAFSILIFYWIKMWNPQWFCCCLLLSFLIVFFKIQTLQLSKNRKFYEGFGIRLMRKVVQDGSLINNYIRKKNPKYRIIQARKHHTYLKTTLMYEKFHWMMAVFFLSSSLHALMNKQYLIMVVILVNNIWYNCYPIMLQQYNRLRILTYKKNKYQHIST